MGAICQLANQPKRPGAIRHRQRGTGLFAIERDHHQGTGLGLAQQHRQIVGGDAIGIGQPRIGRDGQHPRLRRSLRIQHEASVHGLGNISGQIGLINLEAVHTLGPGSARGHQAVFARARHGLSGQQAHLTARQRPEESYHCARLAKPLETDGCCSGEKIGGGPTTIISQPAEGGHFRSAGVNPHHASPT